MYPCKTKRFFVCVQSSSYTPVVKVLSLKQGTGNGGMGNGERGTGNGESLKGGISKIGNL